MGDPENLPVKIDALQGLYPFGETILEGSLIFLHLCAEPLMASVLVCLSRILYGKYPRKVEIVSSSIEGRFVCCQIQ